MKIEIGESLVLSWLKHIKGCQMVQTNWKVSSQWSLGHMDVLEKLMERSSAFFMDKYGYDLYKGSSGLKQVLTQAEIDVMGVSFENEEQNVYAVEVAFHESGLIYGSTKGETVARVIKKFIRAAMCLYGCFNISCGTIIFASPKITPSVMSEFNTCKDDISVVLKEFGLDYEIRIIANQDFSERILEPVLSVLGDVEDTSELFMRSLQMYNMFAGKKPRQKTEKQESARATEKLNTIEYDGIGGFEEMKIGQIANTVLRGFLEEGKVTKEEVEKMQTKQYSKEIFDIQFPLLLKVEATDGNKQTRYYAKSVRINGDEYFLCSEWFEVSANNDRPYLLKWIALHQ
ncbi:MAG TPA: hypothetical protein PK854_12490 [Oscillospiraceae bacterium]|nr:hypothetical protein [Oscillospiraceae bacterium]HPS36069.1 hypothetical protein [Oscillospiraceae bacterium]